MKMVRDMSWLLSQWTLVIDESTSILLCLTHFGHTLKHSPLSCLNFYCLLQEVRFCITLIQGNCLKIRRQLRNLAFITRMLE